MRALFLILTLQANEAYVRHLPASRHDGKHRLELSFPMTSNHFGGAGGSEGRQKQNRQACSHFTRYKVRESNFWILHFSQALERSPTTDGISGKCFLANLLY